MTVTTQERFDRILIEHLGIDPAIIKPETSLSDDLGADSLDVIELFMAVEEEFEIKILDEEERGVATVSDATQLIERKLEAKAQRAAA